MTYEDLLGELMERDPAVVVMTAENRAALRNLPDRVPPGRFVDVGIAEMTMVGAAAGMAARGRKPVIHALSTFLTLRAYEFVRTDVGIAGAPVTLVGAVPGFLSEANGPTHQAIEDLAVMRVIPNMQLVCPCDDDELLAAMPLILESGRPAYVRFNNRPTAVRHTEPYALGKAETLVEGGRVSLLTYGMLVEHAVEAATLLAARGIPTRVVNMRTLAPIDAQAIVRAALESELTVCVEDHFKIGGLFSAVAEVLLEAGVSACVESLALDGRWFRPGRLADVLEAEGFSGPRLADRVAALLD